MTVDFKIIASRTRQEMAKNLRDALSLTDADIVYDDRPEGGNPYVPTKAAWLLPHEEGVTHRVVLNEDVQVCENFKEIIEQMAQSHPGCAFSLFTMDLDSEDYSGFIEGLTTPYIHSDWTMWGCAILMPLSVVEECFSYIDTVFDENVHESFGIYSFLRHKEIPILTTIPVTVQHIGDDSLYDPSLPVRRTSRFEESPTADWSNTTIAQPPAIEWFKPKPKEWSKLPDLLAILKGETEDDG